VVQRHTILSVPAAAAKALLASWKHGALSDKMEVGLPRVAKNNRKALTHSEALKS
jgi:hypothetical protein